MLLITYGLVMLLLTVLIILFIRRFTIVKVHGESMYPTLKDGQFRLLDRKYLQDNLQKVSENYTYFKGRIYVYRSPSGRIVIKRLVYVAQSAEGLNFWFEGDNADESEDSRHYGFISADSIFGEIVDTKTFFKRLVILK